MATKRTTKKKTKRSKKAPGKAAPKSNVPAPPAPPKRDAPEAAPAIIRHDDSLVMKDERLRAFANSFNTADYNYVVTARDAPNVQFLRRPTGIIELDIDLGGGFPAGGSCFISGPDNSGKTWLVLRTMAMQQRIYGHACRLGYALAEGQFPYDQAIDAGMKVYVPNHIIEQWQEWYRLRGMPLLTLDQVRDLQDESVENQLWIAMGATGEDILEVVLGWVRTKAMSVVAIDSLNGLQSGVDAEKTLDENEKVAAQATMIGKFFKKYVPITTGFNGPNETTVLFTQQVRSNQDRASAPSYMQKFIPQYISSGGGWSGRHYKLIGLLLDDGKKLKDGEKNVTGKTIRWFTEKGKSGTHDNKSGEVAFYYNLGGVDEMGELIASGIKRGVIQQRGRQVIVVRPDSKEVLDGFTAPNQKALRTMLGADLDFELALRREILTQAGVRCLYT
jgi:RecA/RadA recombinase